jgi:hypothetical protein
MDCVSVESPSCVDAWSSDLLIDDLEFESGESSSSKMAKPSMMLESVDEVQPLVGVVGVAMTSEICESICKLGTRRLDISRTSGLKGGSAL